MSFDVIVIGGGPAGTATAIAARESGLQVCVVERQEPPFRKVCGEFLSEPGMDLFRRLTETERTGFPCIETATFTLAGRNGNPGRTTPELRLEPHGWGVSRAALDGALLEAARSRGATVLTRTRAVATRWNGPGWSVTVQPSGAARRNLEGRHLVRATGRRALAHSRGWLGRKAFPAGPVASGLAITFVPGGYYGVSPVEDGKMSLCGLSRAAEPAWVGRKVADMNLIRSTPHFHLGLLTPEDPWSFPVGDALATWPPLAGDGMTVALVSGERLGRLLGHAEFDQRAWVRLWRREWRGRLIWSGGLHSLSASAAAMAGILELSGYWRGFGEWLMRQPRSPGRQPG